MQRLLVALLSALLVAVVVGGVVVARAEFRRDRQMDQLLCLERLHATAAIAVMVPDSRVDVDGRLESVKTLGTALDAC